MIAPLLSIFLGAGCFLLAHATGAARWPTWMVATSTATFALGWLWLRWWHLLAGLLIITQPICLYVVVAMSGKIAHPTDSLGGVAGVFVGSCLMLMCAPLPLFTAWAGARTGRAKRMGVRNSLGAETEPH